MITDLRFALRIIATHRWFSLAVIVTIALGIGVNTTVFTLVDAVLFRPLPIPGGERLVTVLNLSTAQPDDHRGVSFPDFREYAAENHTLERLEAAAGGMAILSETGNPPARYDLERVTAGLFTMLQTPPVLGRTFSPTDDRPGAEPVALVGYSVWQDRYGGAGDVVGRTVRINGTPTTIIGVMPAGFRFPSTQDVWLPLTPAVERENHTSRNLTLFGLLKPGTSVDAASRDLAVIGARLARSFPDSNRELMPLVRTLNDTYNGDSIKLIFYSLLGAVAFVLLIACANVANMMLGRSITRTREMSVRAALGASRWQLVRQLLVESVLLSCLGGLLGLGLALFGVHAFDLATQNVGKPYWIAFRTDWLALGYFAAICLISGVVFGLAPALRASRIDLNTALKEGTPGGGGAHGGRLTAALVILQFAFTVVLLASAGVTIRASYASQTMNSFVPADRLWTARLQVPESKTERYGEPAAREQLIRQLLPGLKALPGVSQAAAGAFLPGTGSTSHDLDIEGRPNANPRQPARGSFVVVTSDYLPVIGLPLLTGRNFDERDGEKGREVAVVTRTFAAKHWPGESPLGKRFRYADDPKATNPWLTVVGVCADIDQNPMDKNAPPLAYVPHRQEPWGWMALLLRTNGDPTALTGPARAAVQKLDPDLPVVEVATLAGAIAQQRWFLRVFGTLFEVFAAIALLMASVGIYAVVAQSTARRTREIGIRMALGATSSAILRLVLARGMTQLLIGLAVGLGGGFAATHVLGKVGFLMGISPNDPFVFAATAVLLVAIGMFACWLPARLAAALHPVAALREE